MRAGVRILAIFLGAMVLWSASVTSALAETSNLAIDRQSSKQQTHPSGPIAEMVARVDALQLKATVSDLQNLRARWTYGPGCGQAASYIRDKFAGCGLPVWYEAFELNGRTANNVVAEIVGDKVPDAVFLICAHYDSISEIPLELAPGANDNASGTAAVLECARIMSQPEFRFDCTIRFVLFSGEEQDMLGSRDYAKRHITEDLLGVLDLDSIGYSDRRPQDIRIMRADDASRDYSKEVASAVGRYVPDLPSVEVLDRTARSDHCPFGTCGFDAVLVTGAETRIYRWYHTTQDTIDKLDFSFIARVTQGALASIAQAAGAEYAFREASAPAGWLSCGWNWIAFPLAPLDPNPEAVLGLDCTERLWTWDPYLKASQAYNPPFVEFILEVGKSYALWLDQAPDAVSYIGTTPEGAFETKLGGVGWSWAGLPGLTPIEGGDFMNSVLVKYPSDESGSARNAAADRASTEPWVNWEWWFCDGEDQTPRAFAPYETSSCATCMPWVGYRCYVNVGSAEREADPDQVTLIWPKQ